MKKINLLFIFLLFSCSSSIVGQESNSFDSSKDSSDISISTFIEEEKNKDLKLKDVLKGFEEVKVDDIVYVQKTYYMNGVQPGFFRSHLTSYDPIDKQNIYDFVINTSIEEVDSSEGRIYGGTAYNYGIALANYYYTINTTQNYFNIGEKYYRLDGICTLINGTSSKSLITYSKEVEIYKKDVLLSKEQNMFYDLEFNTQIVEELFESEYKIVTDFGYCFIYDASTFGFIGRDKTIYECTITKGNDFTFLFN